MHDPEVLIVGAGPTGLVLALELARQGIAFRIIDQAQGPGQASRAMAVHARTLEFYQQLGFADEVVAAGIKMEAIRLREGGEEVGRVSFGDIGSGLSPFPFVLSFPQDDHERLLGAKLHQAGGAVEWGVALKDFTETADDVRAVLVKDGVDATCEAAWICGCDGAHSQVRKTLGLDFPGGSYDQLFYVADVSVAGAWNTEVTANLFNGGFALNFPVRSSGMQRMIGIVPAELAGRKDLSFADFQAEAERQLGVKITGVNWFSTYHVGHRVAARFRSGWAFVLGDAGHIHSPAGGQGMNTGIGDAVNLGWKLACVQRGRADAALLDSYNSERIGFAHQLVATTDRVFRNAVDPSLAGQVLRTWLLPNLLPFLSGFGAVRRLMFRTVSQVRINYAGSALSEGKAGDVEGGDRLPWVAGTGNGNFAPLASVDWQAHVYGTVAPDFRATAEAMGLALHGFAWSDAAATASLARDAAYLVRPDGYVALAMQRQDGDALRSYARRHGLSFG